MSVLSRACLTLFEVANEIFIAVGAGVLGIGVLINHGYKTSSLLKNATVIMISIGSLIYVFQTQEKQKPSEKRVVFITGCDSGLGFSLAQHISQMGFAVIAGCLDEESMGAKEIRTSYPEINIVPINVKQSASIAAAVLSVQNYLQERPQDHELYAVINNAGVMVFGEFEWQTDKLVKHQLDVNLFGTLKVSKAFIPLLRKYKGRLLNICSHCSLACLPGLSVYGATKAGLMAFSDGLRVELAKYGVKVVTFIPGSFATQSNILSRHPEHVEEMHQGFTQEQHAFYEDYFQRYNAYLLGLEPPEVPKKIDEKKLYKTFEDALLDQYPRACYKVESWRYALYHIGFKYCPVMLRDCLVSYFMQMPKYRPPCKANW